MFRLFCSERNRRTQCSCENLGKGLTHAFFLTFPDEADHRDPVDGNSVRAFVARRRLVTSTWCIRFMRRGTSGSVRLWENLVCGTISKMANCILRPLHPLLCCLHWRWPPTEWRRIGLSSLTDLTRTFSRARSSSQEFVATHKKRLQDLCVFDYAAKFLEDLRSPLVRL